MSLLTRGERARQRLHLSLSVLYLALMHLLLEAKRGRYVVTLVPLPPFLVSQCRQALYCICIHILLTEKKDSERERWCGTKYTRTAKEICHVSSYAVLQCSGSGTFGKDPDPDTWIRNLKNESGSGAGS
jgi:hypothetical protein